MAAQLVDLQPDSSCMTTYNKAQAVHVSVQTLRYTATVLADLVLLFCRCSCSTSPLLFASMLNPLSLSHMQLLEGLEVVQCKPR